MSGILLIMTGNEHGYSCGYYPCSEASCELPLLAEFSLRTRRESPWLSPDHPFPEHTLLLEGWVVKCHRALVLWLVQGCESEITGCPCKVSMSQPS